MGLPQPWEQEFLSWGGAGALAEAAELISTALPPAQPGHAIICLLVCLGWNSASAGR